MYYLFSLLIIILIILFPKLNHAYYLTDLEILNPILIFLIVK
jgi:hypothetical protein